MTLALPLSPNPVQDRRSRRGRAKVWVDFLRWLAWFVIVRPSAQEGGRARWLKAQPRKPPSWVWWGGWGEWGVGEMGSGGLKAFPVSRLP